VPPKWPAVLREQLAYPLREVGYTETQIAA